MRYSYRWLQEHIDQTLPDPKEIRRVVTIKAFEVEEMEQKGDDTVFDIKVLPDRAHDALSHCGMAREIAALFDLPLQSPRMAIGKPAQGLLLEGLRVAIADPALCPRYIGMRLDGVTVAPSPEEMRKKLESIGERSINTIVDITNIVLFDIGQPMHAFDADKIKGGITVRPAKTGETMETLDGKKLTMDGGELVIADDEGILALAGIKGGQKAEINEKTKNIILESANFKPELIRKTSAKFGIRTEASKRFENGMTSAFTQEGMEKALMMIKEQCPSSTKVGGKDVYPNPEEWIYRIGLTEKDINQLLGTTMTEGAVNNTLERLDFKWERVVPEEVIRKAIPSLLGKPYKKPSSMRLDAPKAFSCSSLVSYLYTFAGVWMPSIAIDKYVFCTKISKEELRFGDLIFFNSGKGHIRMESEEYMPGTKVPEGIDHVALYLGEGNIVHASQMKGMVLIEALSAIPSSQCIVGYGRVLESMTEKRIVVDVPPERLDLRIPEDLIEEIGRHYGYEKIPMALPKLAKKGTMHSRFSLGNTIRIFLSAKGFSEVFTYSFTKEGGGEVKVLNPVGEDRPFLRNRLSLGLSQATILNNYYAPLLGVSEIKIFEVGNVFTESEELYKLALGFSSSNKKLSKEAAVYLSNLLSELGVLLDIKLIRDQTAIWEMQIKGTQHSIQILECSFESVMNEERENMFLPKNTRAIQYKAISPYPFIVRDIALWVPKDTKAEDVENTIREHAGDLAQNIYLFDTFEKGEQVSYAFRIVFQSFDRTLEDRETNEIMSTIWKASENLGWQVR